MAISFKRDGEWVELHEFRTEEVIHYLETKMNQKTKKFLISAKPNFGNSVMANFDGVNFIICTDGTQIELAFEKKDAEKMSPIVEQITKWEKFSDTEKRFYVNVDSDKDNTRSVIFENGYSTCGEYKRFLSNKELDFTTF